MPVKTDVIVIGLGAHGSSTAYHLARRGKRVIGFDRYRPPHDRGSSHGKGRIIRQAYREAPEYVPLLQHAYVLWEELERQTGEKLLHMTGGISIGPADSKGLAGIRKSAEVHGLRVQSLTAAEIRKKWPAFRPLDSMAGVYESVAGMLVPEKCVEAHLKLAARFGADLHFEEPAVSWHPTSGGVEVKTAKDTYTADKLVLTAGAWLPGLLGGLKLPLRIERQVLHWFEPARNRSYFRPEQCPNNSWEYEPGKAFYCQADFGEGYKVAFHHQGVDMDPDAPPGSPARQVTQAEIDLMRSTLAKFVPDAAGRHLRATVCMYTDTPDYHFLVDLHPQHPQVVIGSPCSGHGFKFSAVMGEVLADLAVDGRTRHGTSLFKVGRMLSGAKTV
jgi:sarcosine oxidase